MTFRSCKWCAATVALCCLLGVSGQAFAWNGGGHMLVAQIAYGRLTPKAKAAVNKLLAVPVAPEAVTRRDSGFMRAAVWADDIKGDSSVPDTGAWHYVDNPFGITPDTKIPSGMVGSENIVVALNREIAVLRNPAEKQADKARALRFVLHLVGDIHQPLHCATRVSPMNAEGDRGGNEYRLRSPHTGETISLHEYWDSGLESFPSDHGTVAAEAARIAKEFGGDPLWKAGGATDTKRWMRESEWLAKHQIYNGVRRNKQPDPGYVKAGTRTADKRIAWAGYRLAALLNAVFAN